jgi:hypothetical protein
MVLPILRRIVNNAFGNTDEATETCLSNQTAVRIPLQFLMNANQS